MKILHWLGYTLIAIVVVGGALVIGARFHDGPIEIIAGGPFTSGEVVEGFEPDWVFVRDLQTVEFQLINPARSRTTWIIENDGKIYIPCGYMKTAWGKAWKKWPVEAEQDGRAVLRVAGKLYHRHLVRLKTGAALEDVVEKLRAKYHVPATMAAVNDGSLWIFAMEPVRAGA